MEKTITEWMIVFRQLYEPVDSKRSPVDVWNGAVSHFSAIGEAIRRMHFTDLMDAASHAFCWMCSFILACNRERSTVFQIGESFSYVVSAKYPSVCGHCLGDPCHCNPKRINGAKNKAAHYKDLLTRYKELGSAPDKYTVSRWLGFFDRVYGQHIHMLTLESIGFHFLEEAGEEVTALRALKGLAGVINARVKGIDNAVLEQLSTFEGVVALYEKYGEMAERPQDKAPDAIMARLVHAKISMFIEFADTFSWFCSILNKIDSIARNCNVDGSAHKTCRFSEQPFAERLQEVYLSKGRLLCPTCEKKPCKCIFYSVK